MSSSPQPFLKWAGGKRRLVPQILARLPDRIGTYYEPMVGGAAVFFALAAQRRFSRAVLADSNPELVTTYRAIRDEPERVIELLGDMPYDRDTYQAVRATTPGGQPETAARMIYLNRTGFNGLYRVNRKGEFNVPFGGRYVNPTICDPERIYACSRALQGVELVACAFEALNLDQAGPGDAVYFDPPYLPSSTTAKFTQYTDQPFGEAEHRKLAELYRLVVRQGAAALLSNSDTALTRELYSDCPREVVMAARSINSAGGKRAKVRELLIFDAPR